jgi:uncharacterized protein YjbI with pentapeptide repeats
MPIDNTQIMVQRRKDFKQYESYVESFDSLLNNFPIFSIAKFAKSAYQAFSNLPSWSKIIVGVLAALPIAAIGLTTIIAAETIKFSLACLTRPFGIKAFSFRPMSWSLYKVSQNASTPEMQKLLVEKTSLLEQVGKNKEITKELLNDLVFTQDNEQTKLLKQVTGATIDLLHDKHSRDKLKTELVNHYFKFSLNSFDREGFIDNFIKYEKSPIIAKIKDEKDLAKLLKKKSDIRFGDSNYNLQKVVKSLDDGATKAEISNAMKAQLRNELEVLGLNTDKINALLPEALKLSLQDAQKILQDRYNEILEQKINGIHSRIVEDIRQNGAVNNFDSYVSDILEEHAKYIVDVQEPLYQQKYIDNYVRFHEENGSDKSTEELREEALQYSYNIAPDYMRLTQNVLRVVDSLPDQDITNVIEAATPNLKTVLRTRGKDLVSYVKDFTKEQKITSVLNALEVKGKELTELSSWIKEFDQSNDKTIQEIVEHIFTAKLERDIPENLQEIINSPETQTMLDMLNNFGIDDAVLDLVPLALGKPDGITKVANITESIITKFVFNWAENLLNFLNSSPELQQKFVDNPEMAAKLTKGIVNNIPFLKNLCQDLGCMDQVFDIISILIKTPEDTQKILGYLNEGKYVELAQKFTEVANSNVELRNYLTTHKGVYKQLVSSLFKEIDLMRDLKDNNGITNEAFEEILDSGLAALDNPAKFTKLIDVSNQILNTINQYVIDNGLGEFSKLQKEDYIKVTKIILQNEDLFNLLDGNKTALGDFAKLLVEKTPWLKAKKVELLGNVEIDKLIPTLIESGVLKNRDNVSVALDRYMGDGYKAVTLATYLYRGSSVLKNLLTSAPIMNYLSSPSIDGNLSNLIKNQVNSNTSPNSLSGLLKGSDNTDLVNLGNTKDLSGITLDDIDFSKIQNIQGFSLVNSNFAKSNFSNVEIQDTSFSNTTFQKGVSFENATLKNINFSNAKFSAYKIEELYLPRRTETKGQIEQNAIVSFKNAILKNVNFSDISLIKSAYYSENPKIDFEGAVIDRSTFNSLVSAIKKNPSLEHSINLRGAKIIGDLSELDLSGVNLEGADLSGVSSLKGTIVKGANLKGTNINPELLKEALQLEAIETDFTSGKLDEIKAAQKQNKESIFIGKISKFIVNKLISDGKLVVKDAIQTTLLIEQLNTKLLREIRALADLEKNSLINLFERNYTNLDQFTIDPNTITHYSDLQSKPQVILNSLYDHAFSGNQLSDINVAETLKYEQMKNLMADEIGKKLFGEGQNRGKDFIIIREHLTKVFNQLSPEEKQKLYTSICAIENDNMVLNTGPECEILINSLKDQYYSKTKYTNAGIVTSGVYLPTSSTLDEFIPSNLNKIKVISDLAQIKELSEAVGEKIGEKLFGDNMSSSRVADTQKIITYLNDQIFPRILCELSAEEKMALLDTISYNKDDLVDKLVGDFNKVNMVGMKKVDENSLSQIFYNNTSYTKLGNVAGGVQLNTTKLNSQDFFDSVKDCVMGKCQSDLSKIEELAEKIGNKLGKKLFGEDASNSRKEDIQKIINTLNKVVLPSVIDGLDGDKKNFLETDQAIDTLVGNYKSSGIWGKKVTEPISLAQIFYDNSSYTTVGMLSGGIQIDDSKLTDKPFLDKIKGRLQTEARSSITHSIGK